MEYFFSNFLALNKFFLAFRATDKINQDFVANMNASAKIHLTPAVVKGKYVTRWVSNQKNFTHEQVEDAWKMIQEFATKILAVPEKLLRFAALTGAKFNHEMFNQQPKMHVN